MDDDIRRFNVIIRFCFFGVMIKKRVQSESFLLGHLILRELLQESS